MIFEQINNSSGVVLYLHPDQQGSTRLLTGSTVRNCAVAGLEAIPLPAPVAGGCAAAPEICGAAAVGGVDAWLGVKVFNQWAGSEEAGNDEGEAELKAKEAERESCGNPAESPGSKFKWKGNGSEGSEEGS